MSGLMIFIGISDLVNSVVQIIAVLSVPPWLLNYRIGASAVGMP